MKILKAFFILIISSLSFIQLTAQRSFKDFGIGFQFGEPNGISMKFYNEPASVDLLVAWKKNHYTMVNGHLVFDKHLNNKHNFHFIYGPGAFVLFNSGNRESTDDTDVGVSGLIGLDLIIERFEIFVQAVPRITLTESSDINVGGGLGLRYYF